MKTRQRNYWGLTVRLLAVPIWYPFALFAWLGEQSEDLFWWIERHLPDPYKK